MKTIISKALVISSISLVLVGCGDDTSLCESGSMAYVKSQSFVKLHLKAPSTAKFPHSPTTYEYMGECQHLITGTFTAANAFGTPVRSRFAVAIKFDESTKTYSASDLVIAH